MTPEYGAWANQDMAVQFFHGFLPQILSYAEFILMAVGGECISVIVVLSFHGVSAAQT